MLVATLWDAKVDVLAKEIDDHFYGMQRVTFLRKDSMTVPLCVVEVNLPIKEWLLL